MILQPIILKLCPTLTSAMLQSPTKKLQFHVENSVYEYFNFSFRTNPQYLTRKRCVQFNKMSFLGNFFAKVCNQYLLQKI